MCFNCFGMSKICFKCVSKALSWPSIVLGCFRYVAVTTRDAEGQEEKEEEGALGWATDKIFFLKMSLCFCSRPSSPTVMRMHWWRIQAITNVLSTLDGGGRDASQGGSKIKGSAGQTILHWVRKAWQRIWYLQTNKRVPLQRYPIYVRCFICYNTIYHIPNMQTCAHAWHV